MMRCDVLTLVPEAFSWFCAQHPVNGAIERGVLDFAVHDIRDYTPLSHRQVDDTPYGGGPGMVIRVDVVAAALEGIFGADPESIREDREVLVLSAGGRPFDDTVAQELGGSERDVVLLCGRYEGFDARVVELFADGELSIGPYVLAGGEAAAMVVVEACVRKIPGVLGNVESAVEESFSLELGGAAEYPQYTRPCEYRGVEVPEVLVGGNHAAIAEWRRGRAEASEWQEWRGGRLQSGR